MTKTRLNVGVIGFSGQKFSAVKATDFLVEAFDHIEKVNPGKEIFVVSGYINMGIPALAYEEAVRRGWKTVGIACIKAKNQEVFPCDEVILVGENWGDESFTFLDTCEVFVRVGGGDQSLREASKAIFTGKLVFEYDRKASK